jgi:hypothetical protein
MNVMRIFSLISLFPIFGAQTVEPDLIWKSNIVLANSALDTFYNKADGYLYVWGAGSSEEIGIIRYMDASSGVLINLPQFAPLPVDSIISYEPDRPLTVFESESGAEYMVRKINQLELINFLGVCHANSRYFCS